MILTQEDKPSLGGPIGQIMQAQVSMLAAAISAVETEITKISSKTITEAELEKLGSYAVPAPYQDVLKNNNRFPAPPFSAVAAVSKSEIPPSPRSTRRNPIAEDDVSSLASSTVRRSRRGKADDDAESIDTKDTRSTRRSARGGRAAKDDESIQSATISATSPKAGGGRRGTRGAAKEKDDTASASSRSTRPSKRKAEDPATEPSIRQSSRRKR